MSALDELYPLPDSLYRKATRFVVKSLVEENRRLRADPRRRAARLTAVLATALDAWFREQARARQRQRDQARRRR